MYDKPEGILDRSGTPKHDCNLSTQALKPPSGIHIVTKGLAPVRQGNIPDLHGHGATGPRGSR